VNRLTKARLISIVIFACLLAASFASLALPLVGFDGGG
jgi:hypothetical protein